MAVEYPEILQDMGEVAIQAMERKGIAPEMASEAAWSAMEAVRERWGGTDPYIPKGEHLELAERDREIYDAWRTGVPMLDLVRRFELTEQRIRVIINCARVSKAQKVTKPTLFDAVQG